VDCEPSWEYTSQVVRTSVLIITTGSITLLVDCEPSGEYTSQVIRTSVLITTTGSITLLVDYKPSWVLHNSSSQDLSNSRRGIDYLADDTPNGKQSTRSSMNQVVIIYTEVLTTWLMISRMTNSQPEVA
jgi:hypothetical protein